MNAKLAPGAILSSKVERSSAPLKRFQKVVFSTPFAVHVCFWFS